MLRQIVSLGQPASEDLEPMSPSPGDETQSPEARSARGLAGVFRGLTGTKSTKSPPPQLQPSSATGTSQTFLGHANAAASVHLSGLPPSQMEAFEQLRSGSLNERIAAANNLTFAIPEHPLNPVLELWDAGKDLIEPSKPLAARQAGWGLLTRCVKYEYSTDLERREYFQTIATTTTPEDFHLQLAALVDLTSNGRELSGFEYDIFPLLTKWLQETYSAARAARRHVSRGANRPKTKAIASGQDKNFSLVFSFLSDVVKFNIRVAGDDAIGLLMDKLLEICMNTSVEGDLRACINVINAIVTFGTIPNDRLKDCIHVLSSIHCLVHSLQKHAWHTLSNICKSHHGQSTVRILIDVLRTFPTDDETDTDVVREVRGALSVLTKLLSKTVEKGYPAVPMTLLVDGLVNISRSSSTKIATDILKLINALLEGPDGRVAAIAVDEDWAGLFRVSARCGEKSAASSNSDSDLSTKTSSKDELEKSKQLEALISRVEHLLRQQIPDFLQRDECIGFLTQVEHALPDSAVTLVLDHFKEQRCCFPSEVGWDEKLKLVLEGFLRNRNRRPPTRLQALAIVHEIYDFLEAVDDFVDSISIPELIRQVLFEIEEETDTLVLQETVAFVVTVAATADMELFDEIIDSLKRVIAAERSKAPISMSPTQTPQIPCARDQPGYCANQSLSNVVTRGYVEVFMRSMNTNVAKARKTFNAIVHIARSNACETDARLTGLKMLFRLRADCAHRVYLTTCPESEGLAKSLYRTEASLARKLAEDAAQPPRLSRAEQPGTRPSRGISFSQGQAGERGVSGRAASGGRGFTRVTQRLWSFPDGDALPQEPSPRPSPVLFSRAEDASRSDGSAEKKAALNTSSLLEAVLSVFHQGCDWEVYSFILVHLPAQLSNHPIFADAITQIHELRKVICELIRMNSFQEPPNLSGLRRPDVANCIFHSLAMIMSYHPHFLKSDEDEIVRTFMHGIADKTAKTCIHALSVCCHELPMSVSKSLVTILHKMSQVITQPFVAMHILEFLACLSRLHSLYSNFREEEYRVVFGICFRYLQYVRDKKHSGRSNQLSEPPTPNTATPGHSDSPGQQQNPTDDLPQYVYALAYHVITFWFLALRINDRPNHIGLIAKNLFTDVDGSASNDEQAQITMDFMQRVAFTNAQDTAEDPLFNEEHFGEILQKRWIIGNSIVTIKQAKETAWAQVTRRHPSGMSCFTIRENFGPILGDQPQSGSDATRDALLQSSSTTLPSFLLLQLVAPIPQAGDPAVRPIPLPADEAVDRSIRMFDRNSIVDGHKVGVIYIGDGQTNEIEMLANTVGSPEYVELLEGLGVLTRLKGASFNTQGLDREYDTDGKYTFCWRDRVTEIVFHVTTQMPTNLDQDPQCVLKKRHIGNDFVNIIFNDSGLPFRFDTFPSDFNYVNIVITPNPQPSFDAARGAGNRRDEMGSQTSFFMVQVMSKPGFPEISPAAEPKTVSLKALPSFVRLLALNASVFSHVWANREGGEHISSWRARLREINRLRERYGPKAQPAPSPPPSSLGGIISGGGMMSQAQQMDGSRPASSVRDSISSLRRSSVATFFTNASTDQTSHRSSTLSVPATDNTEVMPMSAADTLVDSVDFSKWT